MPQLIRLADRLDTSPDRLNRGKIDAIDAFNLKSEEQKLPKQRIPALVSQIHMEQLECPQNARPDEIMADSSDVS